MVQNTNAPDNVEIDLIAISRKLWKRKKFIFTCGGIGILIALLIGFSIPKEYNTTVKISPENSVESKIGQFGGLAAMAGINLNSVTSPDALSTELYPDIISSTPFLLELVHIPVETQKGDIQTTFYNYIIEYQKTPWWNAVIKTPFKILAWGISLFKDEVLENEELFDSFHLTEDQNEYIKGMKERLRVAVDEKTHAVTVSIDMQDPLISATIMNTVVLKLQDYITEYRTRKARHDLAFSEKLFAEAKDAYYKIQKTYARYVDENHNVILSTYRTEEERLRNEMNLAYGVYNQMAQQLEMNKIKVQEVTPVFAVIEPAKIPLKAARPNKILLLIGFVFLSFVGSITYILMGDHFKTILRKIVSK
ncbi:Wzz/FepE/Etk N-terminal domain-containing protein [Parabacteroides pacaensis]|uniref:Wzz/FepE/Etk N-terminal domain-containing protein n=1 Tax=Parabacteroides pacaensis TaxID=2086575 RepID=UPI000D10A43A|nr:Wzz/FepE/Etk N-terminal domain-containing protein [Parabacteroides pacaensis]